jgi:2-dehydro-3-deoxyphosphogluconate aldolase/(4S)-4-hydroxy-2-oxoglutarate aldolase
MEKILAKRIVPAATVDRAEQALPLAEALRQANLDIIEITFRTGAAAQAIQGIAARFPEMLVGAGTILTEEQLARAADAGARFGVAPGLNERLVQSAARLGMPFVPGVVTPSEVDLGIRLGCKLLKFFPAENMGGVKTLKALAGPFAHTGVRFVPTGGIDAPNARAYLDLPVVGAVGGSWMVAPKLIKEQQWAEITRLSREALQLAMKPA